MNIKKPFNSYKGDGKFAYACYAIADSEVVFPLLKQLNDDRYRIRYDEGVQDEDQVDALRRHNIKKCEMFLLFMSKNFLLSTYCLNQLEMAKNFGAKMYMIIVDDMSIDDANRLFAERVNSIRVDECETDIILDVIGQLLVDCQEPPKEEERIYSYEELLDEVYPDQENESSGVFEATVSQDSEKIEESAASAAKASKTAITQKRLKKGREFFNAVVVVTVMVLLALLLYFVFGDQIREVLHPDEVVNFIPVSVRTMSLLSLLI